MISSPEFLPRLGIVSRNPLSARYDGLLNPVHIDNDWCAICFSVFTVIGADGGTVGFPNILTGLVQNALDADRSDRSIRVSVERLEQDWEWKIRDQGPGMSAAELSRVSEPFYTTKPPGEGMGLGVFLAKNVIRRLGGAVEFESASGEGTCVTVCLPAK